VVHRIDLAFKFLNLLDVTAAAVNQTAAPATQTSPTLFDRHQIAGNAVGKSKKVSGNGKDELVFYC
jgi:imidazole glycerol phosphate synthase subunit HisF